jgi:hypothetical protein
VDRGGPLANVEALGGGILALAHDPKVRRHMRGLVGLSPSGLAGEGSVFGYLGGRPGGVAVGPPLSEGYQAGFE